METLLILLALKVLSPQLENLSIVKPEIDGDNDVECPGDDNLRPDRLAPDMEGGDLGDPGVSTVITDFLPMRHMDGKKNSDAGDAQGEKHVAAHADEPQKDGGVHADQVHKLLLLGLPQRCDPRPRGLSYRRRCVLLVGVLHLGGVDGLVIWSE